MDVAQIFELPATVSKEVEDEANSFFQRIYNNPPHAVLSIKEVSLTLIFMILCIVTALSQKKTPKF